MKDLIILALVQARGYLQIQVPQTKKKTIEVDIDDVRPIDMATFMKSYNIPEDAYFHGIDNGYDGFSKFVLCYDIEVPTTEKEKENFVRQRFSTVAFKYVYELLTINGYKRVGYNTGLLKEFDDTTVYDMYLKQDFDRLEKYYSLSFKPI